MIRFVLRRPLFFILSIIVLLVQVAAIWADVSSPAQSSSVEPQRDPAEPFFPMRASTDNKKLTGHMFQDPKGCGGCHTAIYKEWESSVMAYAWQDPIYREILKRASKATNGALDNFCIGCHSPIGLTTETVTATGPEAKIAEDGVGCEGCHNISAATGLGNGSFVLTPQRDGRPLKFGPHSDAKSPSHDTAYSDLHRKSEFCATCHNVTHPFNGLRIEETYDEWRDSRYNAEGIHCQDCHMTPGVGVPATPGKTAPTGKERDRVYSHFFDGGNSTLLKYLGKPEMAQRARDLLRTSATLEFLELPARIEPGAPVRVRLRVTNTGAGHKLPTGFPEGREVWVDFKVVDADGREVYRLGAIRGGHTEEGTKSFKAVMGDSKGQVVDINVWEAERLLSDTRIPPDGRADVEYVFTVDDRTRGPLVIQADLNYWAFPQYVVDELLGKDELAVDIVQMESVSKEIPLASTPLARRGR